MSKVTNGGKPLEGPKAKIVSGFLTSLEKWKGDVKSGKLILENIGAELKANNFSTQFSTALQEHFYDLQEVLENLKDRVDNLTRNLEKLRAQIDLEQMKASPDQESPGINPSLLQSGTTIHDHYQEQLRMNQSVVRDIGFVKSEDELVYLSSIWIHQPALSDSTALAETTLQMHNGSKRS